MMAAIEGLGCTVTSDNEAALLQALDMSTAALETVGNELLDAGIIQVRDNTLVMTGGACAGVTEAAAPAPATLVATMIALRDNGCTVSEAGADALLSPLGPREVIMGHLRDLDDTNFVHISRDLGGVVTAERVCSASDEVIASFASQVADMLELPELSRLGFVASRPGARMLFVEWIAAQGCEIAHADSTQGMQHLGFENTLASVVVPLLDGGVLESGATGLVLPADLCAGSAADRQVAVAALPPEDAASE